jgi:hypothetical protein
MTSVLFSCLEKNAESLEKCTAQREELNKTCPTAWAEYFVKKRRQRKQEEQLYEEINKRR